MSQTGPQEGCKYRSDDDRDTPDDANPVVAGDEISGTEIVNMCRLIPIGLSVFDSQLEHLAIRVGKLHNPNDAETGVM